jgi:ABC-type sugar transport system permease subunit
VTTFYVWEIAFKYHQLGMGSALAYTVTILIIALAVVYFRAMNRRVDF